MDASQLTALKIKQNANRILNRAKPQDASTLIWQKQIQSSKYIPEKTAFTQVPQDQQCCPPPSTYVGHNKGSGSFVYSCDACTLQKAGRQSCGVPGFNPFPENTFIIQNDCVNCASAFETDYKPAPSPTYVAFPAYTNDPSSPYYMTNYPVTNCANPPDKNAKHFVEPNCCPADQQQINPLVPPQNGLPGQIIKETFYVQPFIRATDPRSLP
jgi:hypothetical protein